MKKNVILSVFLILFLFALQIILAMPSKKSILHSRIQDYRVIQANDMNMPLTNYGIFGQKINHSAGFYWPSGFPNETYIYGAGIWVGGRVRTDTNQSVYDTLVSCSYDTRLGSSEFVPGLVPNDDSTTNPDEKIYFSSDSIWPLKNSVGDDSVISILDSYCTYNDYDTSHHYTSENLPIDISIIQQTYAFTGGIKNNILFFVINIVLDTSKDTLHDAFISVCTDCDIGNESSSYANDLVGFDVERNMGFQWQNDSEPGWSHFPGHIGFKFLQGPLSNGIDSVHYFVNPYDSSKTDSIVIGPNDTIGMTAFKIFTLQVDPQNKNERYEMMTGYDYKILNDTLPENSFHPYDVDKFGPSDKRFLISSGPFNLIPGDTEKVIFAVLMGSDSNALNQAADTAQKIYDNGMNSLKESKHLVKNKLYIRAVKNNIFSSKVDLEYNVEKEGNVDIDVYDEVGRLVKRLVNKNVKPGYHRISWNGRDNRDKKLVNGIYFVRLESEGKTKSAKVQLIK